MKIPYKCNSPECRAEAMPLFFLEEKVPVVCPECNSDRPLQVIKLSKIHLLIPEKNGPLKGVDTDYRYGCKESTDLGRKNKHLTAEPVAVTCYDCIQEAARLELTTND